MLVNAFKIDALLSVILLLRCGARGLLTTLIIVSVGKDDLPYISHASLGFARTGLAHLYQASQGRPGGLRLPSSNEQHGILFVGREPSRLSLFGPSSSSFNRFHNLAHLLAYLSCGAFIVL